MVRGEIWWAALPSPVGSEPGHRRPVLVVQADAFNRSRIGTVVVAAITSKAPGNVAVSRRESGLAVPSVVNVSQVLTLDRGFLTRRVRTLSAETMVKVDAGLRMVLEL